MAPPLQARQPQSESHRSIEGEMIARASHTHTMFRDDNAAVYYALEEATRSTSYAASIKPFQRRKNGRGALQALTNQYAGNDKWEAEIRKQDDMSVEGPIKFPIGRLYCPAAQRIHVNATVCGTHCISAPK